MTEGQRSPTHEQHLPASPSTPHTPALDGLGSGAGGWKINVQDRRLETRSQTAKNVIRRDVTGLRQGRCRCRTTQDKSSDGNDKEGLLKLIDHRTQSRMMGFRQGLRNWNDKQLESETRILRGEEGHGDSQLTVVTTESICRPTFLCGPEPRCSGCVASFLCTSQELCGTISYQSFWMSHFSSFSVFMLALR